MVALVSVAIYLTRRKGRAEIKPRLNWPRLNRTNRGGDNSETEIRKSTSAASWVRALWPASAGGRELRGGMLETADYEWESNEDAKGRVHISMTFQP